MRSLAAAGTPHPGMLTDAQREYYSKKLTPLKLTDGATDSVLVPEEVAAEMHRLAAEVCVCLRACASVLPMRACDRVHHLHLLFGLPPD